MINEEVSETVSFTTTLWFWGFWGSLAPHLVGKCITPGCLALPISQGRQANKIRLHFLPFQNIRTLRVLRSKLDLLSSVRRMTMPGMGDDIENSFNIYNYIYIFYGGPSPKTYVSNKNSAIYSVLWCFMQVLASRFWEFFLFKYIWGLDAPKASGSSQFWRWYLHELLQVLYVYYIHTTQMTLVRGWNPKMFGHPSKTEGHWSLRLQTIMGI